MTGLGRIIDYDYDRGLGTVEVEGAIGGGWGQPRQFTFHCTAISDGTRRIEAGTAVMAEVGPAGPGAWEALRVRPLSPG